MADVSVLSRLDAVDPNALEQAEAYIRQLLQEAFPDRKFGVGSTFYWGLTAPSAQLAGTHLMNAQAVVNSLFLRDVRNNPEAVTPELVELLLSNYYVQAADGRTATGTVTVVVDALSVYSVPVGALFTYDGQNYRAQSTIYAYPNAGQVARPNDRLLTPRADGRWQFTVPVEAEQPGVSSFVPLGAELTYQNAPPFVTLVEASTDISGGSESDTTADLISRIPDTLAAQTFGSRVSVASLLEAQFPGTKVAMTGFGDREMTRDTHNPLGMSTGSMVDVWVNTQPAVGSRTFVASATLLSSVDKLWEMQVPAAESPGLYRVTGVRPDGAVGTYQPPTQDVRGYAVDQDQDYVPTIGQAIEAGFSAFQTLTIRFRDTLTNYANLADGAVQDYQVAALYQPLVQEISRYLTAAERVGPELNVLVRGAVPCVTSIAMNVRLLDADFEGDIDVQAMKSQIIRRVYDLGFGYGVLSSSFIMDIVHDHLSGRSDVGATTVTLRGDLVAPNGQTLFLQDDQEIRIPDRPDLQITKQTTAFLTDVSRINIQFTRVD